MTNTRQLSQPSVPAFLCIGISILSMISSADAFSSTISPNQRPSLPSSRSSKSLYTTELKQSTQNNDNVLSNLEPRQDTKEEFVHVEFSPEDVVDDETQGEDLDFSEEELVQAMSEQMNDLITTLHGEFDQEAIEIDGATVEDSIKINDATTEDSVENDDATEYTLESELEQDGTILYDDSIVEDVDQETVNYEGTYEGEEEDVKLKDLEETLLSTIQVLEDTLHETQIVNELEKRELKEEQTTLQQQLEEQKFSNQQTIQQLEEERAKSELLAKQQEVRTESTIEPHPASSIEVEGLLDPSNVPPDGLVITSDDLAKLLQIYEERHSQEKKAFELQLKQEEDKRFEIEKSNVQLEAAAAAAKTVVEDARQEDTVLQRKMQKQLEELESADRKMKKLDSELAKSKQALEDQATKAKSEQTAAKSKERELQQKGSKLESELKILTMSEIKSKSVISKLKATQQELLASQKKAKDEMATAKSSAASDRMDLKKTKQSLAQNMAKIGRLQTKLAKAQMQPLKKEVSLPRKEITEAKQRAPIKRPATVTAQQSPRLDNWVLTKDGEVQGFVYNHPSLSDGEPIQTSTLVNPKLARDGAFVKTGSGSRYKLGKPRSQTSRPSSAAAPPTPKQPTKLKKQPIPSSPPDVKKEEKKTKVALKPPPINIFASLKKKTMESAKKEDEKEVVKETPEPKKVTPGISSIFGITSTNSKKSKQSEVAAEPPKPKTSDESVSTAPFPLPRINFFGSTATEKSEDKPEEKPKEVKSEDQNKRQTYTPYTPLNIFGKKEGAKIAHNKQEKKYPRSVKASSTSAYGRRRKTQKSQKELAEANDDLDLTGTSICNGKYLLAGKAKKSVTGRCLIMSAYHADANAKPTGNSVVIKLSENTDNMKKEHSIYRRVASGVNKGVIVKCHSYLPEVPDRPGKSALVLERGVRDLKEHRRWIGFKEEDLKESLYSVAQCLDCFHGARMVWTDLKTENFVVVENKDGVHKVKAIDLESAMSLKDHPTDFTPEASPPEFAKEYVSGDPHSFVLDYSFDVWSFGMLAYELAAGVGYFDGNSPNAIMQKLSQKTVPNPTIGIEDADLQDLVAQCLSLDPKQRPSAQKIIRHPYFASVSKPALFNLW